MNYYKKFLLFTSFLIMISPLTAAKKKSGPKAIGPTGIFGEYNNKEVCIVVKQVAKGSPAAGKVLPGDKIEGIGSSTFSTKNIRKEFGEAVLKARTVKQKGKFLLLVKRKSSKLNVSLQLGMVGPDTFNSTAPYKCPKTDALIKEAAEHIVSGKAKNPHGQLHVGLLIIILAGGWDGDRTLTIHPSLKNIYVGLLPI